MGRPVVDAFRITLVGSFGGDASFASDECPEAGDLPLLSSCVPAFWAVICDVFSGVTLRRFVDGLDRIP
jgi:hypothetical protein